MRQFQWMRNALKMAMVFFLIAPGREGMFDGIPLEHPHEMIAMWVLVMLFALIPAPKDEDKKMSGKIGACAVLMIALTVLKIGAGGLSMERGLIGTYTISGQTGIERSTTRMAEGTNGTRRDATVNFTNKGYDRQSEPLPLWFMNDTVRFNAPDLDRTTLGFEAEWKGYIRLPSPGKPEIHAETNGVAEILIDNAPLESFSAPSAGIYPIQIRYEPEDDRNRSIRVHWEKTDEPVTEFFLRRNTDEEIRIDAVVGWAARGITLAGVILEVIAIFLLMGKISISKKLLVSWRLWTGMALGGIMAYLMISVLDRTPSIFFNFLPSGGDELSYETYARHIQLNGDWAMTAFEKSSYYYQLYYYFLVAFHWIGGESLLAIAMIHACLVASAAFMVFQITRLLMAPQGDIRKAWIGIPAMIGFAAMPQIREEMFHIMPTISGIFFATAAAAMLLWAERKRPDGNAAFAIGGVLMTLAVMNRYNFLSWMPCIVIWLILKRRRVGWKACGIFMLGFALSVAPLVIRNKVVGNEWRIMSKWNSTINFIKGNPVPAEYAPESTIDVTVTPILKSIFDGQASKVVQWIIDEPAAYAAFWVKKIRFALSLYPILWAIFGLISLIWLIRPKLIADSLERKDYILIGGFILTQLVTVTMFSINSERYYFTLIPFLMIGAGMTLGAITRLIRAEISRNK